MTALFLTGGTHVLNAIPNLENLLLVHDAYDALGSGLDATAPARLSIFQP